MIPKISLTAAFLLMVAPPMASASTRDAANRAPLACQAYELPLGIVVAQDAQPNLGTGADSDSDNSDNDSNDNADDNQNDNNNQMDQQNANGNEQPAAAVATIPKVGGTKNPDIGAIVKLEPELVIANAEENRREDVERLRAAGIPVFTTYPRTVPGAVDSILRLGRALSRESASHI